MDLVLNDDLVTRNWADVTLETEDDLFIIDGLVSSRSTLIFGEPKAGKSLYTAGIVASLVTGKPFLSREVHVPEGGWRPLICWTDDGGDSEYKTRIFNTIGYNAPAVNFVGLPPMRDRHWDQLADIVRETRSNILVFDVLSQLVLGDLNKVEVVSEVLERLRKFTHEDIPIIVVAHSSEKSYKGHRKDVPIGHTSISGGFRWRSYLTLSGTGKWTVRADGNRGDKVEVQFTSLVRDTPKFEVASEKSGTELREDSRRRKQDRSKETLDHNQKIGRFISDLPATLSDRETAAKIAEKFGGSPETHRKKLPVYRKAAEQGV